MSMIQLANFPDFNQLKNLPPSDGHPDENATENCLPTALSDGIAYLTGRRIPADDLKDQAYGQGHIGGGSGYAYIKTVAKYGVRLDVFNGSTQESLIAMVREEIRAGHPTLVTMPSHWDTAPANPRKPVGGTHVGNTFAIDEQDTGEMIVANPWGGFAQKQSVAWWRARMLYGSVWPMSRIDGKPAFGATSGATSMTVPSGWSDDAATATLTAPNKVVVVKGNREMVLTDPNWDPANMPKDVEHGDANSSYQEWTQGVSVWVLGGSCQFVKCPALVARLDQPLSTPIPAKYTAAFAAIEALAAAVAADKAA